MMPEHVGLLRDNDWELNKKRPDLTEHQLEEISQTISEAMKYNDPLTFIYYQEGCFLTLIGLVQHFDNIHNVFHIVDHFNKTYRIFLSEIINVYSDSRGER